MRYSKNPRPDGRGWVVLMVLAASLAAQTPGQKPPVPRTADDRPDFSGIWQGGSVSFAIGEANAARLTPAGAAAAPVKPEPLPYNEAAMKRVQYYRDRRGIDDPMARCLMVGIPRITGMPMPFQITQTKDQVIFLYEAFHAFRIIPTDGRPHPDDLTPAFMGDSVARWDGNTLVVDIVGFNDKTWISGVGTIHSEEMHIVERYTRVDYDTIVNDITIEDPEVFTKPWRTRQVIRLRADDRVREYECGENNEDIVRFETLLQSESLFKRQ
jgi:hypothetical protein